jgi:hypothetical protein
MSPEIMDNQRYNSKTDIWSLGCILYELVTLRLPFGGTSMKQLVVNIIKATPAPPSSTYSAEMRELVRDMLQKNPKQRPGINSILAKPLMRSKITELLGETTKRAEFSHTVLHGANVLQAPPAVLPRAPAPPSVPPPAPAPAVRALSAAPPPPPPVASSAAQAIAMLQQQRQAQLARQQQGQAQQQQYVNAVAAQMREQVELARKAEADRVRAQQLQAEEALRRQRQQQMQDRAKAEQARLLEQQRAAEKAKAAAAAEALKDKQQQEQLERLRRAALAEQQQKLERRRQERLDGEAQRAKQEKDREREREREKEKERERAQRARLLAYQQQPAAARAPSPSVMVMQAAPSAAQIKSKPAAPAAGPSVASRKAVTPVSAPVSAPAPAPAPVLAAAPVRQFSSAALLVKRRHSAPEKSPLPTAAARPPWVSVLDPPPASGPAPVASNSTPPQPAARAAAPVNVAPAVPTKESQNPFLQIVGKDAAPRVAMPVPISKRAADPPQPPSVGESADAQRRAVPSSPSSQDSTRAQAVDGAIGKAQSVLQAMQDMQAHLRYKPRRPPLSSPAADSVSQHSGASTEYSAPQPLSPPDGEGGVRVYNGAQDDDSSSSDDNGDAADLTAAPLRAPALPLPGAGPGMQSAVPMRIDTSPAPDSNKGSAVNSPWLSDLMGQMGQLKNQMQNLQQLRSPALPPALCDSPDSRVQRSEGSSSSASVVSSITAMSPASARSPFSGPSSANTPREGVPGLPYRSPVGNHVAAALAQAQEPRRMLQDRAKAAGQQVGSGKSNHSNHSNPSAHSSGKQRMSYPMAESSASEARRQAVRQELQSNSHAEEGAF